MKPPPLDLSTYYAGLPLRSPIMAAASPLSHNLDSLKEMERCGAGAVVFHTLFEEPAAHTPPDPDSYCESIAAASQALSIPVIGSLNARTRAGWGTLAHSLELAGADAIEMNIYEMSLSITTTAQQIEALYLEAVETVVGAVKIPVTVKLPPFFTNLAHVAKLMEEAGAKGLVFFNRFYLPDINLETVQPAYSLRLSTAEESRLPQRWISLLYRPIQADLVANTGIRSGGDVLKMILAGAAGVQVCSVLLQRGIPWLFTLQEELERAMQLAKVDSIREARGMLSHRYEIQSGKVEREEYQNALQGYARFGVTPAPDPES